MIGKIFITRSGYDPQRGRHVNDPYLGATPTLGACRPDIRHRVQRGDHIFVISGKIPEVPQFVMAGFEVAEKINAIDAFTRFPELRLRLLPDGQRTGNIIVDSSGKQHPLDDHRNFAGRLPDYIVGRNLLALRTDGQIARGRVETLEMLQELLGKKGRKPFDLVGRSAYPLNERQVELLRTWMERLALEK